MHALRWTFRLFVASGCFLPPTLKSPMKRLLYNLYTVFVTSYIWIFSVMEVMDIFYNVETQEDLSDNLGPTVTAIITSCKYMNLVLKRRSIISLLDLLRNKPFLPENAREMEIYARYDNLTEKIAKFYTIQNTSCVAGLIGITMVTDFKFKKLAFRTWTPYDITSSWLRFCLTYVYQCVGSMALSVIICIFDTLFAGLLLQICCQLDILVNRLHNIQGTEIESLKRCVCHHNTIFRFVELVNNLFSKMMSVQFVISAVAICFNIYQITESNVRSQILKSIMFIISALIQALYFCWFGDLTKMKSLDISNRIYDSNWTDLSNDAKKMLVIIMARSLTPIEIISAYILPVNLESFKGLMKTIYSAYNMLLQTK
ncbi:hypothetical protein QLX08_001213 [Tetragonisca angustula]